MKYIFLLFTTLILNLNSVYGCDCKHRSIVEELKICNEILVGEIINIDNNKYEIRIIKEWSKRIKIRVDEFTFIDQQNS